MNKELVIAAYQRDYDWVNYINPDVKITIYRKGSSRGSREEIQIENNVGQDVHTFFHHIIQNYNDLADYTFVSQDFPFDHCSYYIDMINSNPNIWNNVAKQHHEGYWAFSDASALNGATTLKCWPDGLPHHTHTDPLRLDSLWAELFDCETPGMYEFVPAGHFCVTKEQILTRSLDFYKKLLILLETRNNCPYEVERLEPYIFNSKYTSKL
jgi:hypothetical protein